MCARRFLIAIFVVTLLAVAGAFAMFQWGGQMLVKQATPKGHFEAKAAGSDENQLEAARNMQRKAQFYLDFVEAENSTGFHAPQEAARILGESIDASRRGQIAVRPVK